MSSSPQEPSLRSPAEDVADFQEQLAACEEALRLATDHGQWDTAITVKLRQMVGRELAATVLATAKLQTKARSKLGDGLWWCTELSLAQATPRMVADVKARWLRSANSIDICCGLGGDTIALAAAGSSSVIHAVDRDPIMVAMTRENARLNLDAIALGRLVFDCQDAESVQVPEDCQLHVDPDRRDESGRKTRPEDYSPDWDSVQRLLQESDGGLVKLAPAAEISDSPFRHRVWFSLAGSVREQTLVHGATVRTAGDDLGFTLTGGERTAVVLRKDRVPVAFTGAVDDKPLAWADKPSQWMVDPDAAIRAAGLTESFCVANELRPLGGPAGFLTGENPVGEGLAICEKVIWCGACDDRKLRKTLRGMDCYPVRVKARSVDQNPNTLEKRYRECGQQPVTLWLGKTGRRQYAVLTECSLAGSVS